MMETPWSDSGTENLIIKISQTRCRNCIRGRSSGNSVCFYTVPPPARRPLPLCKHQYRQCLCPGVCACLFDGEKRGKNCRDTKKKKKNTYRVFYRSLRLHGFSLSLYISVFFTWNSSNRKACVKKHLRALSCRKSTPPCPVTNLPSSRNRPRRGPIKRTVASPRMYRITSHGK